MIKNGSASLVDKQRGKQQIKKQEIKINTSNKKIKSVEQKQQTETDIQQIVNCYFASKGLNIKQIKEDAKQKRIIYSRHVRPAKQLLELAGSVVKAKMAINRVADWAKSRHLDYAIETVFKKWLELDRLRPKEIVKKPFYRNDPMVWSQSKKKWYMINSDGAWLEFADDLDNITWKIAK